jgi:diguanylate cyclase (GGDEF)-like protein
MTERHDTQKILVVDDEQPNIKLLGETLKGDYRIFFATDGAKALAIAEQVLPDLIILDVVMPGMDGYEVCRQLKDNPLLQDIPVIFITAMTALKDETAGLELGAVDYIIKPFNPALIRLRVKNHLELKRQRDLLGRLSLQDGLTGLANRRAFDAEYLREWRRAVRNCAPLSLIMIDIDHFKAYNDTYGHLAGDECLKLVARALAGSLERGADFIARYGGEEFVCILPDTDAKGAPVIAGELRRAVESLHIPYHASPVAPWVTVSLGVASAIPTAALSEDMLIALADRMLYRAKTAGRNRTVCHPG